MLYQHSSHKHCNVALFRRAWIEIKGCFLTPPGFAVALFRRAWIEILNPDLVSVIFVSRSLQESVNWNYARYCNFKEIILSLSSGERELKFTRNTSVNTDGSRSLQESVNWNTAPAVLWSGNHGRSLQESVNWNLYGEVLQYDDFSRSLQESVNWNCPYLISFGIKVCRSLQESVNWNWKLGTHKNRFEWSLSSGERELKLFENANKRTKGKVALFRRAWIEIGISRADTKSWKVALFRRAWIEIIFKSLLNTTFPVALFRRAWIEMRHKG